MTENANRYPEPHEGTVHVVRKAGMRIKAISCELSAASLENRGYERCPLNVILNECEDLYPW